jgi:hypothetical protein
LDIKNTTAYIQYDIIMPTASVVKRSEFLATDPEAWVRFPALPDFLRRAPLRPVSTTEELLERKVAAPV